MDKTGLDTEFPQAGSVSAMDIAVTNVSDEMVDRACAVLFASPGLDYRPGAAAEAHNRQVIAQALAAAMQAPRSDPPSDEDRIREAMAEASDYPGRIVTR